MAVELDYGYHDNIYEVLLSNGKEWKVKEGSKNSMGSREALGECLG